MGLMEKCHHYLRDLLDLPFEDSLQKFPLIEEERGQFIMLFVNDLCEYVLENMEFDINLKRYAIKFYYKCQRKRLNVGHPDTLYTYVVKNINILSSCEHIKSVLACLLSRVDTLRHKELFADILSFVQPTKLLILETISKLDGSAYSPEFEEYIKLKILALEENEDISRLARGILHYQGDLGRSIVNFNMKSFVKKNSKETIEKLCVFVKESMSEETCEAVYALVMRTSEELFD